jgi:hypothetical protein
MPPPARALAQRLEAQDGRGRRDIHGPERPFIGSVTSRSQVRATNGRSPSPSPPRTRQIRTSDRRPTGLAPFRHRPHDPDAFLLHGLETLDEIRDPGNRERAPPLPPPTWSRRRSDPPSCAWARRRHAPRWPPRSAGSRRDFSDPAPGRAPGRMRLPARRRNGQEVGERPVARPGGSRHHSLVMGSPGHRRELLAAPERDPSPPDSWPGSGAPGAPAPALRR